MSMTNEEKYLRERVGQKNHFRTPDGYFDQFATRMMAQLPEQQPVARTVSITVRRWLYAAACSVLALAMGVSYYFLQSQSTSTDAAPMAAVAPAVSVTNEASDNSYFEDAADYVMLDNTEIYAYLSENY